MLLPLLLLLPRPLPREPRAGQLVDHDARARMAPRKIHNHRPILWPVAAGEIAADAKRKRNAARERRPDQLLKGAEGLLKVFLPSLLAVVGAAVCGVHQRDCGLAVAASPPAAATATVSAASTASSPLPTTTAAPAAPADTATTVAPAATVAPRHPLANPVLPVQIQDKAPVRGTVSPHVARPRHAARTASVRVGVRKTRKHGPGQTLGTTSGAVALVGDVVGVAREHVALDLEQLHGRRGRACGSASGSTASASASTMSRFRWTMWWSWRCHRRHRRPRGGRLA